VHGNDCEAGLRVKLSERVVRTKDVYGGRSVSEVGGDGSHDVPGFCVRFPGNSLVLNEAHSYR